MRASVDLYWIPLGAGPGGAVVRWSGRIYESLAARREHRPARALYHSALVVQVDDASTAVEMAPVWVTRGDRGVVAEGAVGAAVLGRWRAFRYEVRCWRGGAVPDLADAVGGPSRVSDDAEVARRLIELVPTFPTRVWGRDELGAGDMWNSNSLTSWLLVRVGVDVSGLRPPAGGRAPGWDAGRAAAGPPGGGSAISPGR